MTSKKKLKKRVRLLETYMDAFADDLLNLDNDTGAILDNLMETIRNLKNRIESLEQLTEREAQWCATHIHSANIALMTDAATQAELPELPWTQDDLEPDTDCDAVSGSVQGLRHCILNKGHHEDHAFELPKKKRTKLGEGDTCSECGMSDEECFHRITKEHKAACCSRCAYTDTHNYGFVRGL